MKSNLATSLSLICLGAALLSVGGHSAVKMIDEDYSCCNIPEIKFDPKYETTWTINGRVIAIKNQCIPPCTHIGPGWIVLNECIEVNATMVLTNENNVKEEMMSFFHGQPKTSMGQPCSGSNKMAAGNQGLWLLSVVITGLFVMIC